MGSGKKMGRVAAKIALEVTLVLLSGGLLLWLTEAVVVRAIRFGLLGVA